MDSLAEHIRIFNNTDVCIGVIKWVWKCFTSLASFLDGFDWYFVFEDNNYISDL